MSQTAAPFGFRASYHQTGLDRATRRPITPAYGTSLYKGMPVTLNTNGTIVAGVAAQDIKGILMGVEFIDASGKPNYQPNWPAGQTCAAGTQPWAWVAEDPLTIFEVQANGSVPLTALGDQVDVVNVGLGSDSSGQSQCAVSATPVGAGTQGQFRIKGVSLQQDNAWGDPFTVLQVEIARDQFVANKVAV